MPPDAEGVKRQIIISTVFEANEGVVVIGHGASRRPQKLLPADQRRATSRHQPVPATTATPMANRSATIPCVLLPAPTSSPAAPVRHCGCAFEYLPRNARSCPVCQLKKTLKGKVAEAVAFISLRLALAPWSFLTFRQVMAQIGWTSWQGVQAQHSPTRRLHRRHGRGRQRATGQGQAGDRLSSSLSSK